tara:strand:- start:308 stop:904 length:597 start_codon:yes stop_codon:yes gene_type:complete
MSVNDLNSIRKLLILGNGWFVGKIPLEYIGRHSCSGAILDEEDFDLEEGTEEVQHKFLSFSNSMYMTFKNLDSKKEERFEFRHLKKFGIYRGDLNPEDLILTNSFEKTKKYSINHWETDDEQYYLEFQDYWKGIYGEFTFDKGEIFDFKNFEFNIEKLDTGFPFYEWVCQINYQGKLKKEGKINKGKRKKRLRIENYN